MLYLDTRQFCAIAYYSKDGTKLGDSVFLG
jgi:hypothetical protein